MKYTFFYISRVATVYWNSLNVLECTGMKNVLENVLENSPFVYWKKYVLENPDGVLECTGISKM